MQFFLMTNLLKAETIEVARQVACRLIAAGGAVRADNETAGALGIADITAGNLGQQLRKCDMVVAVGGDGTIFHCAMHAATVGRPILGVNAGRLGFLSQVESDSLEDLDRVVLGHYKLMRRTLLEVEHRHSGGSESYFGLNDAVLARSNLGSIADISVYCSHVLVGDYRADGIIFATPTGSTAYSLSAGGPIVDPALDCLIMTPICPHSMYDRSIVFSPDKTLVAQPLFDGHQDALHLVVDGQVTARLLPGAEVRVRLSDKYVQFVDLKNKDFYQIINQKLRLRG